MRFEGGLGFKRYELVLNGNNARRGAIFML